MREGPSSTTSNTRTEELDMSEEKTANDVHCCEDIGEDQA